jgi:hypothetical protein
MDVGAIARAAAFRLPAIDVLGGAESALHRGDRAARRLGQARAQVDRHGIGITVALLAAKLTQLCKPAPDTCHRLGGRLIAFHFILGCPLLCYLFAQGRTQQLLIRDGIIDDIDLPLQFNELFVPLCILPLCGNA